MCLAGTGIAGTLAAQSQLVVNPTSIALSSLVGNPIAITQNISISSSGDAAGSHLSYTAFVQNAAPAAALWISLISPTGVTPGVITVSVLAAGGSSAPLTEGVYTAQVLIGASGAAGTNPILVPISFTVAEISAAPASLSFNYEIGGSVPAPQNIMVSGPATPAAFSATLVGLNDGNWLEVAPTSGSTPGMVTASLNPAVITGLSPGTYNGAINLSVAGDSTFVSLPVVLTVSATPQVTASPSSMTFGYQLGGTDNVTQQNLSITSSGTPVVFQATAQSAANPAGVQWLILSNNASSSTPATLTLGVSPGALPAGTYTGQVTILVNSLPAATVNVSLTVSTAPLLTLAPSALSFTYQVGGAIPPPQSILTASTGTALAYSPFPIISSGGGSWLEASSGLTTPNPILVDVNPTGLGAGVYNGAISVSATNAANSPQKVPVTLTVTNYPFVEASPSSLTFVYQIGQTTPGAPLVNITSSTGDTLDFTFAPTTNSGGNWLDTFFVAGPTTPGSLRAAVAPISLTAGTYTGDINITATNPTGVTVPNSPLALPVTLYVSNDPLLIVSPSALSFTTTLGGQSTAQAISLTSTSSALNYSITTNTQNAGPWMAVATQPGQTPSTILVTAIAGNLSAGTYQGSITIAATNPSGATVLDSPTVIPVTFQVVEGTLAASPASLTFVQTVGGTAPASQSIAVTGTGSQALGVNAAASTNNGVNWLTVKPSTGTTPATLSVSVDGGKLSAGTYLGTITISAPNAAGSPQTIAVTLTVSAAPNITLTPATLQFNSQIGGTVPVAQTVAVAASAGSVSFATAAKVSSGSTNWLSVTPASGTSPGNLSVTVNPAGLAAGNYTGTVTVTAAGAGNSPQTVGVTLAVAAAPLPLPGSVVSAASQVPGVIAPGEIISIYGTNLGPATGVGPVINGNSLGTVVSGIEVTFGNTPAPLLYVSATQINAVVPFEISGQLQTQMVITNNGSVSTALDLSVAAAAPGIFTVTQNGMGQGAILNSTGGVNSASNPAPQGSVIILYATGGGETSPQGITGNITPNDGTGLKQIAGVKVSVAGLACTVGYAGSAPGFVEGAMQLNVQLPAGVPSGSQPVVVTIDSASSQAATTVAVQ